MIRESRPRRATKPTNAREIIGTAIQQCAADHVASTVSVVSLPSDDMKGRIIGAGSLYQTLETTTGSLHHRRPPEAVILSGFDPVRREVTRIA